ncbi:TBC1 domain family member 2B-like [Limulus polyphemus]|uniref:TBC1 domain family member 2B-like n=1 Tax=Limulus polyphemus TaxID=6850 RepID=A0ABM1TLV8_LIMPO|nr:TBC1 domain family member 2B-like [Limulus polyphemus]
MAGWNSVSGYLVHRPGGTLGRLKSKRRLWYVYDEGNCNLLYYKNEADSSTKQPLGAINIRGAAISLGQAESNEFIIYSDNKVYVLAADNHESLMIWTMGLQRSRDVALSRLSPMMSDDITDCARNHQSQRRKESLPSDQEMQAMIRRAQNAEGKTKIFRTHSLQLESKPSVQKTQTMLSAARNIWANKPVKDSFLRLSPLIQSLDHSEEDEKGNETSFDEIAGETGTRNKEKKNEERLDEEEEACSFIDLDRNNNDSRRGSLERYTKNSEEFRNDSDSNNSARESDSSAQTSGSETLDKDQKSCIVDSQRLFFSGERVAVLKKINSDSNKTDELKRDFDRTGSVSSDSAMGHSECGHSVRLQELEADLMTTKCELAKALNREAGCKSTVSEKDLLIRDLHDRIRELEHKEDELWHSSNQRSTSAQRFQEKCRILQNLNRFLNEEVMKLSHLLNEERNHSERQHLNLIELQEEIEQFERDYVFLLQSSIRFTFRDGCEMMEVYQYGEDRHKAKVLSLLEKARKLNPSLPAYDGELIIMSPMKQFIPISFSNYIRYVTIERQKELKSLVRGGIPSHLRHLVWSALCRQKLKDVIIEKGSHYYNNLCSLAPESEVVSENRRQIGLDLLRTIPSNVRFSDPNADGVRKLQEVLQAFCLHNPSVGYCQGMNFLVGMCLLFLEPEDAFWCLVAVTEKHFTPNYFDQNLIGAQADQEVLKDLLKDKLPNLHRHLASNDIEISTITLNWFLAVFFDAVPFEIPQ